jgi:hypothetical protein
MAELSLRGADFEVAVETAGRKTRARVDRKTGRPYIDHRPVGLGVSPRDPRAPPEKRKHRKGLGGG